MRYLNALLLIAPCVGFLAGCGPYETREQMDQRLEAKYMQQYTPYDCPHLYQKYRSIKNDLNEEINRRNVRNTVNMTVDSLQSMGALNQPQSQFGYTPARHHFPHHYENETMREIDYAAQIRAIENLSMVKQCQNVAFF